jgi:hypothetical protein
MPTEKQLANLKKYSEMSPTEKHDFHSKGGQASTEKRRQYKTQAEILRKVMTTELTEEEGAAKLREMGLDPTWAADANVAVVLKARRGDVESLRYVRDTIGEKPRDGLEIGNLDGQPLSTIDMSQLSDEQLKALIAARTQPEEG